MAAVEFDIREELFYDHYNNMIGYVLIPISEFHFKTPKQFDTAILNCVYTDGRINGGRHLSPIYRTITYIQFNTDFVIISIRP